jgi:hypothetical protein
MKNMFRSLIAILLLGALPLMTTGCTPSAAEIAADGNAVATALLSIAALEQPTDPTAAANLTTAANALKAATANWTTGSPTADINSAATAVEVVLASIPQTAIYAPLVAITVAALDAILAATGVKSAEATASKNPYHGMAKIHRSLLHPTLEGAFKAAWKKAIKDINKKQKANFLPQLSIQ